MNQQENEHAFIIRVKRLWDEGVRSSKSVTGRYFKASDMANHMSAEEMDVAKGVIRKPRHEPTRAVALALSYMTGKVFTHGDKTCYLDKYAVDGTTVYRFEERDSSTQKYAVEEYDLCGKKCYKFVKL